jgi:hypothetical protein
LSITLVEHLAMTEVRKDKVSGVTKEQMFCTYARMNYAIATN